MAQSGDEGRDYRRYASGSRKYAMIRRFPNGVTRRESCLVTQQWEQTRGSETSQYPEEKKSNEIPGVAASEMGRAQTKDLVFGVVGLLIKL